MTKINAIILLIFLMASLLAGTPTAFSQEGSPPDKVMKFTGDANWPPYQFLNEAGEPDGFCVDLVRALCQEQNLRCEFELYQDWAQAQQAVADGLADAVLGFGKTTEREKLFDFSETIATIREVIAVREETLTVHSLADLYGTSVAAVSGTPDYLQLSEDPRFHVIPVRGEAEGLRKLANREAKAFISDELAIRYVVQLREIEGLKIVGSPIWEMEVVIGVTKGKHELLEMVNAGLSSLKEGGTTDEITTKWFGSEIRPQRFPSWIRWAATVGLSIGTLIGLAALGLLVFNRRLAEEVKGRTAALEQEVHERKRAEEALRQSEYLLRQVLDTNPAVIFVKDYDSRVLLANKTMAEFYNLSVEEVTGRLQSDLHRQYGADPKDVDKWLVDDREVIDTGRPKHLVESGTDSQNRPLRFQTGKYPIDIGPAHRGVLVISEDITEHKRAEEALREAHDKLEQRVRERTAELQRF
ncbi:MAG: transporter substrate-binding domain-containing protein, partial [Anaerolineae bacterium]